MQLKEVLNLKLIKNGMWMSVLQLFNTIIPLLTLPYITKILGADGYGTFAVALNLVTYFQVVVEYGFGLSGARRVALAKNESEVNTIYSAILASRLILTVISMAILFPFIYISNYDKNTIICVLILYVMVLGTAFQLTWLFQGKENMKPITITNVIARIVSLIAIFSFVKTADDMYLYCLLYAITTCISSGISFYIAKRQYFIKFKFVNVARVVKELQEGWYLFTSTAMSKIFGSIGVTILGFVGTNYEAGIYSAISKIPSMLILFFLPVSQTLYPHVSKTFALSEEKGINTVKTIGSYIMGVFGFMMIVLIIFRTSVINIAFGSEFAQYASLLIPLLVWMMASILNNFLGIQILVASGRQRIYSISFTISIFLLIVYNLVFISRWRLWGIAMAAAVSEITLSVVLIMAVIREFKCTKK